MSASWKISLPKVRFLAPSLLGEGSFEDLGFVQGALFADGDRHLIYMPGEGEGSIVVASSPMEGVIVAYGHPTSGFVLYMQDGRLHYEYNAAGPVIAHSIELPDRDPLAVHFDFELLGDRAGRGRLTAGGNRGEWFDFDRVLVWISLAGMDLGRNAYGPISTRYEAPFPFQGNLQRVSFRLGSEVRVNRRRDDY